MWKLINAGAGNREKSAMNMIKSNIDLRWLGAVPVKRDNAEVWMFGPAEDDVRVKLPPPKPMQTPRGPTLTGEVQ
jgi:hypothetical protein